jgi:hypothetical protein
LLQLGYKIPLDSVWPVGAYLAAKPDWWHDPEEWVAGIANQLASIWTLVAPQIDDVLNVEYEVSDG